MKSANLICSILLLTVFNTFAQQFTYLRPQDGLYDGEINSVEQDESGLMWFATWSGLISYDGINYQLYRPEIGNNTSLPDKKIKKLYVDSKDNLWVITSRSLNLYDKEKDIFRTIEFDRRFSFLIDINFVSEIDNNLIIHALEGFYIFPLEKINDPSYKAKKINVYNNQELVRFASISKSVNNKLFIVSLNNTLRISELNIAKLDTNTTGVFINVERQVVVNERINSIEYVKAENNAYFATNDGIISLSLKNYEIIKNEYFKGLVIRQLLHTSDHKLYCTTDNPELLYIDLHLGTTGKYIANPNRIGTLLNSNIHCLFEDFSGNLWIGHQGQGLSIKNLYLKEFDTFRRDPLDNNTLRSNIIMCFNGTNDEILIGCRTGGLNIMKKNLSSVGEPEYEVVKFDLPNSNRIGIWNIAKENDELFWVATDLGLFKLVKSNGKWKFDNSEPPIYRGVIRNLFIDKNKNLWCGTWRDGLLFIPAMENNPTRKYYQYRMNPNDPETLSDNFVQTISLDSKGRFWIGTVNGFNLLKNNYESLDLSGDVEPELKFKRYIAHKLSPDYLNNNEINCIFENFDGKMWIATQGGGINIFDTESETFEYLTTDNGLPGNNVLGILRDHMGKLWISTNKGLVSYSHYKTNPEIKVYGSSDGIQGEIFMVNSFYKSLDGEMFFGGDNGFTRFYPSRIKPNQIKPKIILTSLRINNTQTINVGDTINRRLVLPKKINFVDGVVLPFKNNTFSIGVSSIHYQYPEGNNIQYKLEGYESDWRTAVAMQRFAYYSNLPFGEYVFKAKAISSDNVPSDQVKSIKIEILPPWYRTWYMSIVFFILVITVIGGFIFVIINRQRLVFEQKIDKITLENNESKMVFLTNIAHELKTPLSLVIAPIDDIMQNYKTVDPFWKNHLQLIYRNSKYLLKLINQIVDFRKLNAGKLKIYPQNTDIVRLIKDVVLNFKYMESRRKVNLSINVPANKVIISIDAQKIEEVLYNLLSNAFKHTEDHKSIIVSLEIIDASVVNQTNNEAKQLKISVFNEGREIKDEDKAKIFERFYKSDESIEGAGIGLSFSKSLVEMHNGVIEVETIKDKGVSFHVFLPFDDSAKEEVDVKVEEINVNEPELDKYQETGFLQQFEPVNGNGADKDLKIVIVEDNVELRGFLKNILSRIYHCYEANDGLEGWKIVKDIIPDIVISDIIMPNRDGYQLCRQIKENLKTCHIPVILLSAKNAENQIISGYNVGADAYVTKPFDMKLILSQISRLIKNRELIREKYITQNFMVEVTKSNLSKDDEFIMEVRNILEDNITDSDFNVKKLSAQLNISTTQLYRKLKVLTGYSPVEFIRVIKLQKAYNLLNTRNNTVKEVCYLSGFNNLSYFIKCFREHFGVTPANYRDKGFAEQFEADNTNITSV